MREKIILRKATIADLGILGYWDQQPLVIASDPNDDWNWETELQRSPAWREQLIAELDGEPVGFVQIIDPKLEETHYWGDVGEGLRAIDIWIGETKHLGKGYGTRMMQLAIQRCFSNLQVKAILIDPLASNFRAIKFYRKLGFKIAEERRFGEDDTIVLRLERQDINP